MKVSFLGAAGTVTGSKFLIETNKTKLLVDCGLYQGLKELRLRNWQKLPVAPEELDAVILTHAHIDHSGFLPVLARDGFTGRIFCSPPTADLCTILLPDSGRIHEEDAAYANRKGFSKHRPAVPLYSEQDAVNCLRLFSPVPIELRHPVGDVEFSLQPVGHILGATSVTIHSGGKALVFSGDLGRYNDLLELSPPAPRGGDIVVMESTYGNRLHDPTPPVEALAQLLNTCIAREGVLLIPAFALGRAQVLLYCLAEAFKRKLAPKIPVYLNSPMASKITNLYKSYPEWHRLNEAMSQRIFSLPQYVNSVEESKELNGKKGPMVIISASGMLTGGRILHHLKQFGPDPRTIILLPGFQAEGTRGAALVAGKDALKIHGSMVPINAEIHHWENVSAHGDQEELLRWLDSCKQKPRQVYLVHGEAQAAEGLRLVINERLGIAVEVAKYQGNFRL